MKRYPEAIRGSKHDNETRARVIGEYAIRGSYKATSRHTGIAESTVRDMVKSAWGQSMLAEVRAEKSDQFVAKAQEIIEAAAKQALDRLPDANAREAATVGAIFYDKMRLALNQPTSIKADTKSLEALAKRFEQLSSRNRVISTQDGDGNEVEV